MGNSQEISDVERAREREWIANDERAPRAQAVSVVHPQHPQSNEDRVLCDPELGVAAVFDGMGGQEGGELAARAACGAFAGELDTAREDSRWLVQAVTQAANAVKLSKRLHAEARSQGATAVAILLAGERVFAVAVGDSRAYRYRADVNELTCLTPPFSINSERQRLLERLDELSSQKELDADPTLHMMFRSRNIMDVELGTLKGVPEVSEHKVKRGDLVFVCSDGVSDNLTSREMRDLLAAADKESGAASAVASALAEAAYARSASTHVRAKYDDISVACLRV